MRETQQEFMLQLLGLLLVIIGAQYYMQYYFDYTNNYIIHMNYIDIVETGLNIWPNWSMILVGKLQT